MEDTDRPEHTVHESTEHAGICRRETETRGRLYILYGYLLYLLFVSYSLHKALCPCALAKRDRGLLNGFTTETESQTSDLRG